MLQTNQPLIDLTKLSTDANNISQQLIDYAANYQQRCLVLLDPFLSPIDDPIIDYFASLNQLHQVRIMHPSILADKRPLLLELNLADLFEQQALSYIIDNALSQLSANHLSHRGQQYCGWLFTNAAVNQVADDLAKLALQKRHNKTLFLRFYDPAIFAQLISLLTASQQKKLYGKIEHWAILNHNRELVIHSNSSPLKPVLSGQLGLSEEQLTQLYCIGINNQMLQQQRLNNLISNIDTVTSLKQIMPSVARMLAKKINDETLLVEWAKLAIRFGMDFDLQPSMIEQTQNFTIHYDYYRWLESISTKNGQEIMQIKNKEYRGIK
ncbi:DUF4123 domain-containing protein [Orbus wheelerorum]|uniref:DUF4123 domain-containing protein n=1 Tax=Orbus wheelerorum TaxID=3074111 RepID=UPI00370D55DB